MLSAGFAAPPRRMAPSSRLNTFMADTFPDDVTRLLGDTERNAELLALVYQQLRAIAQQRMSDERAGHTLQATALVHEAYLRLLGDRPVAWANRAHFFYAAAEAMRRILIEHARGRGRVKRGGGAEPVRVDSVNVVDLAGNTNPDTIVSLDAALCRLEREDAELAAIVRLRFYAGLNVEDSAAALGMSPATIKRRWAFARAWLFERLREDEDRSAGD
jgi:RNA polymerase sigma factor (TIGR02999 family)